MKKADAPPAGWYPDPTGGARLWWWDGQDWTDARRAPPNPASDVVVHGAGDEAGGPGGQGGVEAAVRGSAAAAAGVARGTSRQLDPEQLMAQARRVARQEVERGVDLLSDRATTMSRQLQPLITEYGGEVVRWVRRAIVVVVVLVVAWFFLQAVTQATAMDWLGERVDNFFNGAATSPATWIFGSSP